MNYLVNFQPVSTLSIHGNSLMVQKGRFGAQIGVVPFRQNQKATVVGD
ncbi:hypothetical protein [Nitrosomonas sp.]